MSARGRNVISGHPVHEHVNDHVNSTKKHSENQGSVHADVSGICQRIVYYLREFFTCGLLRLRLMRLAT
jgi:hypothetical protein